ncbi:MAG: hypothetical protein MN733_39620 [Nitrososphaera sp.]|nr:hypothetical protein [Nitrososphaera sp.]
MLASLPTLCDKLKTQDVLDYGCGKGLTAAGLPFPIKEYDPAIEGKDTLPEPADVVLCLDVLEHVEPECISEVLDHLASLTKKVGIFNIALYPAMKTLADGRNAHLIVESAWWWAYEVSKRFAIRGMVVSSDETCVQLVVAPKV